MATGIETAGLVLAMFPIIVKGLTGFVEGVDTVKTWRKYKWQLADYVIQIEGHMVFYLDTLEELLDGIVDSDEIRAEMIKHPGEGPWRQSEYEKKLKIRLGRSYDTYVATIHRLQQNLNELKRKLDLGEVNEVPWEHDSIARREIKRIKLVLSRNIHNELISKIEQANRSLREFTHQGKRLENSRKLRTCSIPSRKMPDFYTNRKWTRSLHGLLIGDNSWNCECRTNHAVNLGLDLRRSATGIDILIQSDQDILTEKAKDRKFPWNWQGFSVVSKQSMSLIPAPIKIDPPVLPRPRNPSEHILCFCETIHKLHGIEETYTEDCISLLLDTMGNVYQHKIFPVKDMVISEPQSLETVLSKDSEPKGGGFASRRFRRKVVSRGDRLFIAMILASSILQVDELWFDKNFRSGNILIIRSAGVFEKQVGNPCLPYLSHQVVPPKSEILSLNALEGNLTRNEALLGLCLTLVELSFAQTLSNLREPEDIIPGHDLLTDFNTVMRLLPDVFEECGEGYGRVVRWCVDALVNTQDCSFENDIFAAAVFDNVVTPLEDDWKIFYGLSDPGSSRA